MNGVTEVAGVAIDDMNTKQLNPLEPKIDNSSLEVVKDRGVGVDDHGNLVIVDYIENEMNDMKNNFESSNCSSQSWWILQHLVEVI